MSVRAWSVDAFTGKRIGPLPVAGSSRWEIAMSAGATSTLDVPIEQTTNITPDVLADRTEHWSRIGVLERDGVICGYGYIADDQISGGSLSLTLQDVWTILGTRLAIDHNHPHTEKWSTVISGVDRATIAKRVIQLGTTGPNMPDMRIPITLPPDVKGDRERPIYGYHLEYVGDVIQALMTEGLDVVFEPRWLPDGRFDLLMRTGEPLTTSVVHGWKMSALAPNVEGFQRRRDSSRVTNNARVVGEGSERDMIVRSTRNPLSSLPLLDRVDTDKMLTTPAAAAAAASRALVDYATATEEFSWTSVNGPRLADVHLGDTAELLVHSHRVIANGLYRRRIIRLAGDLASEKYEVTTQPSGGL